MDQASSVDHSTLQNILLEMSNPAVVNYELSKVCVNARLPHEKYFDSQPPFQLSETILTGSWSEDLSLYVTQPPDMDFMCVLKNITFSQEDQKNGNLILKDDTPFVDVFMESEVAENMWSEFLDDSGIQTGKRRLSSKKLKEELHKNYQERGNMFSQYTGEKCDEVTEGAAVTIRNPKLAKSCHDYLMDFTMKFFGQPINELNSLNLVQEVNCLKHSGLYNLVPSSDIVLSIFCDGWPSCAGEWIARKRHWPDKNSVEKITQRGFHIVPKSSPDGEFRLSFSCAETTLVQTLLPLQHKIMKALKAVVKFHQIGWPDELKCVVSSYHLKTIAFWYIEKTLPELWTEDTVVHHLVSLLEELAEALRKQKLSMYFLPKVNLFKHVDNPELALDYFEEISQLSRNFPAMSEAVKSIDFAYRHKPFELPCAERLLKEERGEETPYTVCDAFEDLYKIINAFC